LIPSLDPASRRGSFFFDATKLFDNFHVAPSRQNGENQNYKRDQKQYDLLTHGPASKSALGRGVICQIIEDNLGKMVGIMLPSLRKGDNRAGCGNLHRAISGVSA
jgi:hypothetical protein